jgi:hypothetical protein
MVGGVAFDQILRLFPSGAKKPGLRFDRPVEFANCPFSDTAGRPLTIRGHRPVGGPFSNDKIAMAGRVLM